MISTVRGCAKEILPHQENNTESSLTSDMTKHSKNNTASSVFSYAEKQKTEYGTKRVSIRYTFERVSRLI